MKTPDKETPIAVGCLVLATFFFALIPVFLRHLRIYLDFWTVNGMRYTVGALFWLPYVAASMRRLRRADIAEPVHHRNIWRDALVPTLINVIGQIGWGAAPYFEHNDPPTIGFTIRLSFLFTAVFGFIFVRSERPLAKKPLFLAGAAVCVGGLVMMFAEKLLAGGGRSLGGMGMLIGTAAFWGMYAISIRHCLSEYPIRLAFGVISLYTAAILLVLMCVLGKPARLAQLPLADGWVLLIVSAFLGIAFGHVLYYRGIRRLGAIVASGILLTSPFVTLAISALFFGEGMTVVQFLGGVAVIIGGVFLLKAKAQVKPVP